jgi:hypothetical protein
MTVYILVCDHSQPYEPGPTDCYGVFSTLGAAKKKQAELEAEPDPRYSNCLKYQMSTFDILEEDVHD